MDLEHKGKRKLIFYRPYVDAIAKQYVLPHMAARSLLNALLELSRSQSMREIKRVQSFCFYSSATNGAIFDLYEIISKIIGTYDPAGSEPVYRLRNRKKRDMPETDAKLIAARILRESFAFFKLPPDALYREVPEVSKMRYSKFHAPVFDWGGEVLAHAISVNKAAELQGFLRGAGDYFMECTDEVTQMDFRKIMKGRLEGRKISNVNVISDQIYMIARLMMSETYVQFAQVMGYLRIWHMPLAAAISSFMPEIDGDDYMKGIRRMPKFVRPVGEPLKNRGIEVSLKVINFLSQESMIKRNFRCEGWQAERMLLEYVREALVYIPFMGRLSARDLTSSKYNYFKTLQYVEIKEGYESIATAVSKEAAIRIVKAEEALGRRKVLARAQKAIDAYLSADDLI